MLKMGFFQQFKGADTALISGTSSDIADLSVRLQDFTNSSDEMMPIHTMASVSERHPVELFACRSKNATGPAHYYWHCSPDEIGNIKDMLQPLVSDVERGHQYFELVQPAVQLVVSVGEYGADWWRQHG